MNQNAKALMAFATALMVGSTMGCGSRDALSAPESGSPVSSLASPIQESAPSGVTLTQEQKTELERQAVDFALHFPVEFQSTAELELYSVAWYTFWKMYEQTPDALDAQGYLYLAKADVDTFAQQRFGIDEVSYTQEAPPFDEATQTYAFTPVGESPWLEIDMGRAVYAEDGTAAYTLSLYDKATGEEMPYRAHRANCTYTFRVCTEGEQPYLQAISNVPYPDESIPAERLTELYGVVNPLADQLLAEQKIDTAERSVALSYSSLVFVNGEDCHGFYLTDERDRKNERLFECALSKDTQQFYFYQDGQYLPLVP